MGERWAGAVLTGGASVRMGRDKSAIEIGGAAMADRVVAALRGAGADDVVRIGGPSGDIADDHPGEGPLAGVLAALAWSTASIVVVAPCDLLAPDASAFARLAASAGDALAAVPALDRPLPIALRAEAAAPLAAAFAAGERSLRRAVAALPVVVVEVPDGALADADEPRDLPPDAR